MADLDLDAITAKWLQICGSCDAGIGDCTHPAEDYRPVMLALVEELTRYHELHDYLDEVAREAEPVMLASAVVEISPTFPVAWPAVHAGLIQRALAKANGSTIDREASA